MMNPFRKQIAEPTAELESLKVDFTSLQDENETLKAELIASQESAASYQLQFIEANEKYETLKGEFETLKGENETIVDSAVSIELKASELAAEIVAEAGVPAVEITEDAPQKTILEQLASFKAGSPEKQEFYNANKQEIFKALTPKVRG